ncbi:MAG: class I SAM-dependent methyltransferase [Actinomycetota bacterium]
MSDKPEGFLSVRRASADLRAEWERNAPGFIAWVRKPNHDSYDRFHRDVFLGIVPEPGHRTLDLGCGEGRLSRDLEALGHRMIGLDASPAMVEEAHSADPSIPVCRADAARVPFADESFDLVIAFMSLQDVDDAHGAIREAARILEPGGRFCIAIVHPLNAVGHFEGDEPDSAFRIEGSYLDPSFSEDTVVRDGLEVVFVSADRPLQFYADAITRAGLLIDRIAEPALPEGAIEHERSRRWTRMPLFLHVRAVKPG